jgi:hypothetical protein
MIEVTVWKKQRDYYPLWRFAQGRWWYCYDEGEVVCFTRREPAEVFVAEMCRYLLAGGVVARRVPEEEAR